MKREGEKRNLAEFDVVLCDICIFSGHGSLYSPAGRLEKQECRGNHVSLLGKANKSIFKAEPKAESVLAADYFPN